ncbi:MAG: hypothetical protein JNN05_02740, partial [Candidatus Omnitrophica bacterium]|nr:hypothetical protein [Candidatus Omnitrophota bacterium]
MRVLSVLLIVLLVIYPNGLLYAEVILDKPVTIVTQTKPIRSPQQIISDFQATVDKIQIEQQTLHTQIEIKTKENTLLLRKLNAMSVR